MEGPRRTAQRGVRLRVRTRTLSKHKPRIQGSSFFFSSRRRHTRSKRDWSSDVCSSDLADHLHGGDTTVAGDDQPGAQTARLGEPGRPEVVAVAQPVRDERVDPAADAREHTGEQRRGTLAVHVVVAVDQDRGTRPDGGDDELDRPRHIGPGVWIGETLEVRAEERFGELGRGEPALHEEGGERLRDVEVEREGRRELWIGRRRDRPAGGDHSGAYSSTPQASQPSIDAPRWIRARRCVGTAVKQWPQASPCSAYNASGALPRRIRS